MGNSNSASYLAKYRSFTSILTAEIRMSSMGHIQSLLKPLARGYYGTNGCHI